LVSRSCGTAVVRNRIKRRLRSAAREVSLQPGNDYVIIASAQVAEAPYDRLVGWLDSAVEEMNDA
jgi:ribonuclease P protein component